MNIFDDGPLGPWQEEFTFVGEKGCAATFIGFVLFLVVVLVVWQVLIN
jgi:hypothetical protein